MGLCSIKMAIATLHFWSLAFVLYNTVGNTSALYPEFQGLIPQPGKCTILCQSASLGKTTLITYLL